MNECNIYCGKISVGKTGTRGTEVPDNVPSYRSEFLSNTSIKEIYKYFKSHPSAFLFDSGSFALLLYWKRNKIKIFTSFVCCLLRTGS